jgi:hypothetical protein
MSKDNNLKIYKGVKDIKPKEVDKELYLSFMSEDDEEVCLELLHESAIKLFLVGKSYLHFYKMSLMKQLDKMEDESAKEEILGILKVIERMLIYDEFSMKPPKSDK